ncbi:hypothetical protein QBC44DRAFT_317079 [Cladorrhinum sp. PSN332]|nr:hypothetical protein QBC44DRAFT_317079 [Cladorrhinum sp. PSN332]
MLCGIFADGACLLACLNGSQGGTWVVRWWWWWWWLLCMFWLGYPDNIGVKYSVNGIGCVHMYRAYAHAREVDVCLDGWTKG